MGASIPDSTKNGTGNTRFELIKAFTAARQEGKFTYAQLSVVTDNSIPENTLKKIAQGVSNTTYDNFVDIIKNLEEFQPGLAKTFLDPWLKQFGLKAIPLNQSPKKEFVKLLKKEAKRIEEEEE